MDSHLEVSDRNRPQLESGGLKVCGPWKNLADFRTTPKS